MASNNDFDERVSSPRDSLSRVNATSNGISIVEDPNHAFEKADQIHHFNDNQSRALTQTDIESRRTKKQEIREK